MRLNRSDTWMIDPTARVYFPLAKISSPRGYAQHALVDMESYAHSKTDQANYFYRANVALDIEKTELETEIEALRSRDEALRERVSTLEHAPVIGVGNRDCSVTGHRGRNMRCWFARKASAHIKSASTCKWTPFE